MKILVSEILKSLFGKFARFEKENEHFGTTILQRGHLATKKITLFSDILHQKIFATMGMVTDRRQEGIKRQVKLPYHDV